MGHLPHGGPVRGGSEQTAEGGPWHIYRAVESEERAQGGQRSGHHPGAVTVRCGDGLERAARRGLGGCRVRPQRAACRACDVCCADG